MEFSVPLLIHIDGIITGVELSEEMNMGRLTRLEFKNRITGSAIERGRHVPQGDIIGIADRNTIAK